MGCGSGLPWKKMKAASGVAMIAGVLAFMSNRQGSTPPTPVSSPEAKYAEEVCNKCGWFVRNLPFKTKCEDRFAETEKTKREKCAKFKKGCNSIIPEFCCPGLLEKQVSAELDGLRERTNQQNLIIYIDLMKVVERISDLTDKLLKCKGTESLREQLLRATTTMVANQLAVTEFCKERQGNLEMMNMMILLRYVNRFTGPVEKMMRAYSGPQKRVVTMDPLAYAGPDHKHLIPLYKDLQAVPKSPLVKETVKCLRAYQRKEIKVPNHKEEFGRRYSLYLRVFLKALGKA